MGITTKIAAARLGLGERRIRRICEANRIGTLVTPRLWLLRESDLPRIAKAAAARKAGRPKRLKAGVFSQNGTKRRKAKKRPSP